MDVRGIECGNLHLNILTHLIFKYFNKCQALVSTATNIRVNKNQKFFEQMKNV